MSEDPKKLHEITATLLRTTTLQDVLDMEFIANLHKHKHTFEISEAESYGLYVLIEKFAELCVEKFGDSPTAVTDEVGVSTAFAIGFAMTMSNRVRHHFVLEASGNNEEPN